MMTAGWVAAAVLAAGAPGTVVGMPPALPVGGSVAVDAGLLAGLPAAQATLTIKGVAHACSGVALADVLARLGVPLGKALRGRAMQRGVVVRGRDGYGVLFSLGELDAATAGAHGAAGTIIADRCDGAAISAADGPWRLVVPGDVRPARSVRQVAAIDLR